MPPDLDYAEDSCALRRAFAGSDRRAVLELRQSGTGDGLQFLVASDVSANRRGKPSVRLEQEREARERGISGLQISGGFARDVVFRTGELHGPMTALRACVDDLLAHWGLDAQVQRALSRPVQPIRQMDWARRTMGAYPPEMIRAGQGARVDVRLMVGSDGKPTSCAVPAGTVHPSFEKAACASSMRHARFEPALDAQGQPVPSYFVTTVVYEIRR